MKIVEILLSCLKRRSFLFLGLIGFAIILLIFLAIVLCEFDESTFFNFLIFVFPILSIVTLPSIILIYVKLLIREYFNPTYRLKNKVLTQNYIYAFIAYILFLFAVVFIIFFLYGASCLLKEHSEICELIFQTPILYIFLVYTFFHVLIILKI